MPLSWNELSLLAIAAAVVILVLGLLIFLTRLKRTLDRLDGALSSGKGAMDAAAGELGAVAARFCDLETAAGRTLEEVARRVSLVETEIVPLLRSLRETVEAYGRLGVSLNARMEREVASMLENARAVTEDARRLTEDLRAKVAQTGEFFEAAREGGEAVRAVTRIARHGVTGLAVQVAAMAAGAKSSLEFLADHFTPKGGDKK